VKKLFARLKARRWRAISADVFMLAFILLTGVGAYMILPAAGFITAGVTCGLYGYLLGSD
jgi:TRAP-type C4-dicarboxylate transport system permease small subunit